MRIAEANGALPASRYHNYRQIGDTLPALSARILRANTQIATATAKAIPAARKGCVMTRPSGEPTSSGPAIGG